MSKIKTAAISLLLILAMAGNAFAICPSTGAFDMFNMVNWGSIFPISIAGIEIAGSRDAVMTVPPISSPICVCPMPPPLFFRIGLTISFWEPARYIETVKDAWCIPSLGVGLDSTSGATLDGVNKLDAGNSEFTFAQAHYFIFPVWAMLGLMVDSVCVESEGFDIAYMTELDPLWQNDGLSAIINPEAVLFGNPVAQFACMADSVSAAAGAALSPLFWCMGSWGSAYPLTGSTTMSAYTQANAGIAARMLYKLSRELLVCDTNINVCGCMPTPIWVKHNYKMHVSKPVKDYSAHPIGRSGLMWDWLKNPPTGKGDNYVWMLYRMRGCCAF